MQEKSGVLFGRPRKLYSFDEWAYAYLNGELMAKEAIIQAGVSHGTFFRRLREMRCKNDS